MTKHTPFLKSVAQYYHRLYGKDLHKYTFVFPTKRAGLFFRKYLSEAASEPIFSPHIITINDFILRLFPDYTLPDRQELLFMLHHAFTATEGNEHRSIDDFIYWGGLILNDFDEIDRYLVDAKKLYTNLKEFKDIHDLSYLSDNQREAIKTFWGITVADTAAKKEDVPNQSIREDFNLFWQSLAETYRLFRKTLESEKKAYEGMIYRQAATTESVCEKFDGHAVFVGLFHLSKAEMKLLSALRIAEKAEFCWDHASIITEDENHIAHKILHDNIGKLGQVEGDWLQQKAEHPMVEVISTNGKSVQSKILPNWIKEVGSAGIHEAVILPQPELQMPVVSTLSEIVELNISIGYPLDKTSVAITLSQWFKLLLMRRWNAAKNEYSVSADLLLNLLTSHLIARNSPQATEVATKIRNQKFFFIYSSMLRPILAEDPLLQYLFADNNDTDSFFESLQNILRLLSGKSANEEKAPDEESANALTSFDVEFIYHYTTLATQLQTQLKLFELAPQIQSLVTLVEELIRNCKIPFEGEPLRGLQVMGQLETRTLNFDHIAVLSADDSILPGNNLISTLIPYTLRIGYGLPVGEEQEATTAYNFFRLLGGAQKVTFIFDATPKTGGTISRYVQQLKYIYGYELHHRTIRMQTSGHNSSKLQIRKTDNIIARILERELSPSALKTYISCPLHFYYEYVEKAYEEESPEILMNAADFGNVAHKAMEDFYLPYQGKEVQRADIENYLKETERLDRLVKKAYKTEYLLLTDEKNTTYHLSHLDLIYIEMVKSHVKCMLEYDMELTPFTFLQGEQKLHGKIRLKDDQVFRIKGTIDRIDRIQETIRIVDYKTGKIADILQKAKSDYLYKDSANASTYDAISQLLYYAELYEQNHPESMGGTTEMHLYAMRLMQKRKGKYESKIQIDNMEDYASLRENYGKRLKETLEEIMDKEIPFAQTENPNNCSFCPFTLSCGR